MELIIIILLWLVLGFAAGAYAGRLDRSAVGWALFSLILSPLIGFIVLLALGPAQARRPCPKCAEKILPSAKLCPHCRTELAEGWAVEPSGY